MSQLPNAKLFKELLDPLLKKLSTPLEKTGGETETMSVAEIPTEDFPVVWDAVWEELQSCVWESLPTDDERRALLGILCGIVEIYFPTEEEET